jgi:DNA-binding HxlR family transcriptional regulator
MPDTLSEYFESRGGLGLLVVLKSEAHRYTDIEDKLHISTSTLTKRLAEARELGFVTPEFDADETSVDGAYRITERGQFVLRKMEQLEIVHAYKTMLDMHKQVEDGRQDLLDWVSDDEVKLEIGKREDIHPYVDEFGEDVTGYLDS